MATHNSNFELTISDMELIEEALRARGRELSQERLGLGDEKAADVDAIRAVESNQRAQEELLGRLHDQKVFYRPKVGVYVSG